MEGAIDVRGPSVAFSYPPKDAGIWGNSSRVRPRTLAESTRPAGLAAQFPVVLRKLQETLSSSGPVDLVRPKPTASGRATLVGSAGTA